MASACLPTADCRAVAGDHVTAVQPRARTFDASRRDTLGPMPRRRRCGLVEAGRYGLALLDFVRWASEVRAVGAQGADTR